MANKAVRLRVLTPNRVVADEEFDLVIMKTIDGDKGILPGHEPCLTALDIGLLRGLRGKDDAATFKVLGGFASVHNNEVTVMSSVADAPEKIDQMIEKIKKERAENKIYEKTADVEMNRVEMALRRSLVKNDISAYAIIKGKMKKEEE